MSTIPIVGAIRSALAVPPSTHDAPPGVISFVTISRQAGAGGWTVGRLLAQHLSAAHPDQPWTAYDGAMVTEVATDATRYEDMIDELEERHPGWYEELFAGLSATPVSGPPAGELAQYHRVAKIMRALASTGRVVLVGRGGVCVTRGMKGGVHVRLVAPTDFRVAEYARRFNLPKDRAAVKVRELDQNRLAFFHRHWPEARLEADVFTLVLNAAQLSEAAMVRAIAAVID